MNKAAKISVECGEEISSMPIEIQGVVPEWLQGTFVRNGPVNVTIDNHTQDHWFDGLAMLHGFSFNNGKISYSNKFLRTTSYQEVFKKGHLPYNGFAQDPCKSLFKRFFSFLFSHSDELPNANVNVSKYAEDYVALTEVPLPVKFDPRTLETVGVHPFYDSLPKKNCWESAHPHYNADKKSTVNYLIDYGPFSSYIIYRLEGNFFTREVIAKIPVKEPSYMHSFAVTENYAILVEFPYVVKPLDLILKGRGFIKNFFWDETRGTQFTVINLQTGEVVGRYKTRSFFAFHHVNAFEKEGELYLDIVCYDNADIVMVVGDHFREKNKPGSAEENFTSIKLERFTLSLESQKISSELIFQGPIEFPRINDKYDRLPYNFMYAADPREPSENKEERAIYKINTRTYKMLKWSEADCFPGEPVFVANPQGKEEDEGVILNIVIDLKKQRSFLLILDGKSFTEIGRGYSKIIPVGLHGQYFGVS